MKLRHVLLIVIAIFAIALPIHCLAAYESFPGTSQIEIDIPSGFAVSSSSSSKKVWYNSSDGMKIDIAKQDASGKSHALLYLDMADKYEHVLYDVTPQGAICIFAYTQSSQRYSSAYVLLHKGYVYTISSTNMTEAMFSTFLKLPDRVSISGNVYVYFPGGQDVRMTLPGQFSYMAGGDGKTDTWGKYGFYLLFNKFDTYYSISQLAQGIKQTYGTVYGGVSGESIPFVMGYKYLAGKYQARFCFASGNGAYSFFAQDMTADQFEDFKRYFDTIHTPTSSPTPTLSVGNNKVSVPKGEIIRCRFKAPVTATYKIYTTGSDDTYGYIYDATGLSMLTSDDNSGSGNNFKVTYELTAGETYYIGVKFTSSSHSAGQVTLVIQPPAWTLDNSGCLTVLQNVTGQPWSNRLSEIKRVVIADGVTSIGSFAFNGCSNLTSITIPDSVTSIGSYAFQDCSSLTSIYVDSIEQWLSYDHRSTVLYFRKDSGSLYINNTLLTSITIPDSVTSIGYAAFYRCSSLTSITIPDSVTSIGDCAFKNCINLTSITIPDSVTSIGSQAFNDCSSLSEIHVDSVEQWLSYDHSQDYYNAPNLYLRGNSGKLYINHQEVTSITIPDSVTSIGSYAFSRCSSLSSITIPDSVTSIGSQAFYGCSSLTSITIPDSVTSIGSQAFYGCSSLTSITLPFVGASRTATGSDALFGYIFGTSSYTGGTATKQYYASSSYNTFYIPSALRAVTITNAAKLSYGAFYGCSSLTSITIPDNVTSIGYYAFYGCSSLTSITIPDSVTSIGYYAFYGCSSLTSIYVDSIEQWLSYNHSSAYLYLRKDNGSLYINNTLLTGITIPDSVTSIGSYAFRYCSSLTSITIPDSVTSIGPGAFDGCSSLTSIYVDSIEQWLSYNHGSAYLYLRKDNGSLYINNTLLTSITIPDSVTSIGDYAFRYCSSLTGITIPNSVTSIGYYAFYGCSSLTSITIPDSVTSIGYCAFYKCSSLTSIIIPNSVTSIGNYAFSNCSSLTGITIPDSVTSIGSQAFSGCSSLTSITIPDSVTSIGNYAFSNCSSLTGITIPDSVTSIGSGAFDGCSSLTSIYVDSIEQWLSYNHSSAYLYLRKDNGSLYINNTLLTSITIPDSVTSIGSDAFYKCSSLTSITIPNSVTSIGNYAFSNCSSLTGITIPDSVTSIDNYAFSNCSSLTGITIPDGVTSIGSYAFQGCSSLTSITIPNSVTSIGNYAFYGCSGLTSITLPFVGASRTATGSKALFGYIFGTSSYTGGTATKQYYASSSYSSNTYYIPSTLQKVTITDADALSYGAFYGCSSLTSITIPDSVTSIGSSAFSGCSSLTSITLPFVGASRTATGSDALFGYIFGTSSYTGGTTTKQYYSSSRYSTFYIPSTLRAVMITDAAKLQYGAFYGCSSLTSITIPDSVTSIGDNAFLGCTGLVDSAGVFILKNVLYCCETSVTSVRVPDGVTSIASSAFSGCNSLTNIEVPDSVTSIGSSAFSGCSSLTSITLPFVGASRTATGSDALFGYIFGTSSYTGGTATKQYYASSSYSTYYIPSTLQKVTITDADALSYGAFYGCRNLTDITIPNSVTSIGNYAFSNCSSLTSITLPFVGASRTATGSNALFGYIFGASSYTGGTATRQQYSSSGSSTYYVPTTMRNVTIMDAATLSFGAFHNCSDLTSIKISGNATVIGDSAFENCSSLTSITLPESVRSIDPYAFYGCSRLTSITIPDSLTQLRYNTFQDCVGLTSITLPEGVTTVESNAFFGMPGLKCIMLPDSLSSIADNAYNGTDLIVYCHEYSLAESWAIEHGYTVVLVDGKSQKEYGLIDLNETADLLIYEQEQLTWHVFPLITGVSPVWTTSDAAVAQVSNDGIITAIGRGDAIITLTYGEMSASCAVHVDSFFDVGTITIVPETTQQLRFTTQTIKAEFAPVIQNMVPVWTSSDESVLTVSQSGVVQAISRGTATVSVEMDGITQSCEITVYSFSDVGVITLKPKNTRQLLDTDQTITAVFDPPMKNMVPVWTSSNESVLTVDQRGIAHAVHCGTATVTVEADGVKQSVDITVYSPVKTITLPEDYVIVRQTTQLTPVILPEGADNSLTWTSSNTTMCAVDSNGLVNGKAVGDLTITVTDNATKIAGSCTVHVLYPVSAIELQENVLILEANDTAQIEADVTMRTVTLRNRFVTYTSSDETVAVVDETGLVTAVGNGSATITVADLLNNVTAECTVHVAQVTDLQLQSTEQELRAGETMALTAKVSYGDVQSVNNHVTFTTSDESIATVDETGLVTAVKPGEVTLTASSFAGVSDSITIIVFRDVTVNVNSTHWVYDGTPHRADVSVADLDDGYSFEATTDASVTDVAEGTVAVNCDSIKVLNVDGEDRTGWFHYTFVPGTIAIDPKEVTVSTVASEKTYGEQDPIFTANVVGTLNDDVVEYAFSRTEGEDVGEYVVTVSGDTAQGNYSVSYVNSTLTINHHPVVVTVGEFTKTYGEDDPEFTYTVDDLVGDDQLDVILTRRQGENIGEYVVRDSSSAILGNYAVTYVPGKLTINRKPATVTANACSAAVGDDEVPLTATVDGTINNDKLVFTLERDPGDAEGRYIIHVTGEAEQGNYQVTFVNSAYVIYPVDTEDFTTLNLPSALKQIDAYAFENVSADKIVIPAGVKKIGAYAFGGSVIRVQINAPEIDLDENAFASLNADKVFFFVPKDSQVAQWLTARNYMVIEQTSTGN